MIEHVGLVGIWVSDQDAAIDFYVGKLGFQLLTDIGDEDGYRWVEVAPFGAETGIILARPDDSQGKRASELIGTSSFIFHTTDIATTYRELAEQGVIFTEPPAMQPWGKIQAQFVDPDNNSFILVERTSIRS